MLRRDLAYALRMLRRAPGFTVVALLVIAVSVGAATLILNAVYGVLQQPLRGVPSTGGLVWVTAASPRAGRPLPLSYPDVVDYGHAGAGAIEAVAAYEPVPVSLGTGGEPVRITGHVVIGEYFALFGVRPAVGRLFAPAEMRPESAAPVVVIGHDLWRGRFNGDPGIVNREIQVNGRAVAVIGVASPEFTGPELGAAADVWLPAGALPVVAPERAAALLRRDSQSLTMVARLAPETAPEAARQQLAGTAVRLSNEFPESHENVTVQVTPMKGGVSPANASDVVPVAALLTALTAIALLIAGMNLAGLQVARSVQRSRDAAIQLAMGAPRSQLIRHAMFEGAVLAVLGGTLGLLVAAWLARLVTIEETPFRGVGLTPPAVTVAAALGFAVLGNLVVGAMAAWLTSRGNLLAVLTRGATTVTPGRRQRRIQSGSVVAQLALSLVLLFAAAQFVRALRDANTIDLGFRPEHVTAASFDLTLQNYDDVRRAAFERELLSRVGAVPGVTAVALASAAPLSGVVVLDRVAAGDGPLADGVDAGLNAVTAGYFSTLQIPLTRGRPFTDADREGAIPVAILNSTAAEQLWPGQDPVGRTVRLGDDAERFEVVGVAGDAKYDEPAEDPSPFVYLPLAQRRLLDKTTLLARSAQGAEVSPPALAQLVHEMDPSLPVFDATTLPDLVRARLDRQSAIGRVLSLLGFGAVAIAVVGLYGVVAYDVTQRTREIGIRVALGSSPRGVVTLIVSDSLRLAVAAVILGTAAAVPVALLLANAVFGLRAGDIGGLLGASLLLVTVVVLAALIPARRAARIRPLDALRAE